MTGRPGARPEAGGLKARRNSSKGPIVFDFEKQMLLCVGLNYSEMMNYSDSIKPDRENYRMLS